MYNLYILTQTNQYNLVQIVMIKPKESKGNTLSFVEQIEMLNQKMKRQKETIIYQQNQLDIMQKITEIIIDECQNHENSIIEKLQKLEAINIKYIKDYIQLKQQMKIEDIEISTNFLRRNKQQFIRAKRKEIESIKIKANQDKERKINIGVQLQKNVCYIIKQYLENKQVDYEKAINQLEKERKQHFKDKKTIQSFKEAKEQAKIIDDLKQKSKTFKKTIGEVSNQNVIQIFHLRKQLETEIIKKNPKFGEIGLQESLQEQKICDQLIKQIIQSHLQDGSLGQIIAEANQSFFLKKLSKNYGESSQFQNFYNEESKGDKKLFQKDSKNVIINKAKSYNSITNEQFTEDVGDSEVLYENDDASTNLKGQLSLSKHMKLDKAKTKQKTKLNNLYETQVSKNFFNEQQKARDKLIQKQNKQIKEHQQVIDKLITIIKREAKDGKIQDIDVDDPEQLLSYYFKVNEKKEKILKQEMESKINSKLEMINELSFLKEQAETKMIEKQTQIQQKNEQIVQKEEIITELSLKIKQNTEAVTKLEQNMAKKEQKIVYLLQKFERQVAQKQILITTLQTQKIEIANIHEIYHRVKAKSTEYERLNCQTEDLVKISLQTLFNICMNKISPSEMIEQLEIIIEIIKKNLKCKNQIRQELNISQRSLQKQLKHSMHEPSELESIYSVQVSQANKSQPRQEIELIDKSIISGDEQVKELEEVQCLQMINKGLDEQFIEGMKIKIQQIKSLKKDDEAMDMKQMFAKYKQAVDCLQRAQNINLQNQRKYQRFIRNLGQKRIIESEELLLQKLFYMERIVNEQNILLENQRKQFQQTILKQVQQSELLAQEVIKNIRRNRTIQTQR